MSSSTITAGKFSYSELGLLYDLEPRCTQSAILKRLLTPDQVSLKFLKAQLAHYSLKLSGNKDELEARLKKAITDGNLKSQPKELKDMEKGLKAAFEARGGGKDKGKVEKKKKTSAAGKGKETTTAKTAGAPITAKTGPPATIKRATTAKKKDAALHAAIAAATRRSHPTPLTPKASPKPRAAFADNLLGTYTVSCITFPSSASTLNLYRHSLEPKLAGSLNLGEGAIHALCTLDWLPMAKQSRVPFSGGGHKGEMEFSVGKGGVRVKGRIEGGPWGEVEWMGVKAGADDVDGGDFMDVAW
ncbi:hypothetical protein K440DRAFT_620899 [Wilcoxina mikolae CBS 423.85]|nr:hypothetical protein K440DRAFT_620899 [Wilcoxina mikolae CBS 423.85]